MNFLAVRNIVRLGYIMLDICRYMFYGWKRKHMEAQYKHYPYAASLFNAILWGDVFGTFKDAKKHAVVVSRSVEVSKRVSPESSEIDTLVAR